MRRATFIESPRLSRRLGMALVLASETFQYTGSFKFRAAYEVASSIPHRHLLTASSGNFGQALAYACGLLGKSCTVVMPDYSAGVKVGAVREYGGNVELVNVSAKSRLEHLQDVATRLPEAYVASPYDDPLVIRGNASLGRELAASPFSFDAIVVPVGGGGLSSGIITGLREGGKRVKVIGVEPERANDLARSLKAGKIVSLPREPDTLADGARTLCVGARNWPILREGLAGLVEVSEEAICEAVRLLFALANVKAEPTGALGVAALLQTPDRFRGQQVCCVVSGGNVDPDLYREILSG